MTEIKLLPAVWRKMGVLTLIVLPDVLMWTALWALQGSRTGKLCLPMTQWFGDLPPCTYTCRHW